MSDITPATQARNQTVERILVVGPAWVGDMLLSQALYKSLRAQYPQIVIDVIAPAWSNALLHRMPEVADAIELPLGHGDLKIKVRRQCGKNLQQHGYSRVIVLPRSFKAALLPWFAAIPLRTGYRGEMRYGLINDMRPLDKHALPRIIDRYVFLGQPRGSVPGTAEVVAPCLQVDRKNRARCLDRLQLNTEKKILALLPGAAFGPSKRWPPKYFAETADYYTQKNFQVWIFGSKNEMALGDEITAAVKFPITDLCGKLTLEEVIDVLSLASLAISNDSGLMHIAAAVGCSVVAVYGATSPAYTPPMTSKAHILRHDLPCSPCQKPTCRYGHYHCLTKITPTEICQSADRLKNECSNLLS